MSKNVMLDLEGSLERGNMANPHATLQLKLKASIIISTIFAASAWAGTLPTGLTKRQNAANEQALQQAREDAAKAIEGGQGRGRVLIDEGNCSEAFFACGTAAVAVDVLTAGAAVFLEAAGFVFCEASVITNLNEKEETCTKE
ncbi:uncharacterized protein BKA55DRAFT_546393 [Fusarium redolens]|uniref:Uncharacterized protein n=1 Tax=Fusarium redolens TaxID=48865 RepID=A0A9P9FWJ8_FUSRE|nr:uncharacterized protein BKA55DRAFT_546393 [Fusarium redolens]KAH7216962.1 hypothetical protein BKA55DRAFT_546393 [Fusarium redolens]